MSDPKPLPHPDVRYMFDASGKPTQQAYEFLERLVKVAKDANAAIATLQAAANAPANASYVTLGTDPTLTVERVLTAGAGVSLADGGGGSTITVTNTGLVGSVLQVLQNQYTANADLTTDLPIDDTVPTNTEGDQVLSQAITLAAAANKVLINVDLWGGAASSANVAMALFRGTICIAANGWDISSAGVHRCGSMCFLDTPGSVGPHTYTVRVGTNTPTLRLNGTATGRLFGGVGVSTLTLMEIKG